MLVACRLTGLSALKGQYDRVDERVQICRRGPQRAASARTSPFCAPALAARDCKPLATAWHSRAALPRSCPHSQSCSQGWTVVDIGLPLLDLTMDQFIDIEDGWSMREDRV
jgi:hypothetical protein